jgi:type IV pilus assembly protein PilM
MASSPYAWGIDIGKSSLKALRCRISPSDPRRLVAEGFDVVEYPMMLSQPEADAEALVRAALEEFLSRNDLGDDRVAISAPGNAGLAKFIKLPPVETKKIPDIVKYEASQQIPFPLDQVVWDWQRLAAGFEEGGFVMDAEVALFAMKRDQVARNLAAFEAAGIGVDILQLTPIALANMAMFDQLPDPATIDPDNPPASIVLVSIGVDSTDLVVTNGLRVWQRSMPIGGASFTKGLVQELKYTFAKAEKEKINAVRAKDPRAVFKAMRPVFNQFATELQRSLNYFTGTDRTAKIGKVFLLGNAAKLRGLSDFVAKQLQLDVHRLDTFGALEGPALTAAAFRENRMGFATAYGLALQAAGGASLGTNLLPSEIARDRLIAAKRPWALAAVVTLLLAGLANFTGWFLAAGSFQATGYGSAFSASDGVQSRSRAAKAAFEESERQFRETVAWERHLLDLYERRFQALDLMRALTTLLPSDPPDAVPEDPADRNEIHIASLDMQYFPDLSVWFQGVEDEWALTRRAAERAASGRQGEDEETSGEGDAGPDQEEPSPAPLEPGMTGDEAAAGPSGPSGPGWVVQIVGYHYHNEDRHKPLEGEQFVREGLINKLLDETTRVPVSAGPMVSAAEAKGQPATVSVADLGIGFPVIVERDRVRTVPVSAGRGTEAGGGRFPGMPGMPGMPRGEFDDGVEEPLELKRYAFTLQFTWQPEVPGGSLRPVAPAAGDDAGLSF